MFFMLQTFVFMASPVVSLTCTVGTAMSNQVSAISIGKGNRFET
ncbi:hypothetical protein BH11BAC6_BH11BAC6_14000 [soil metagenome]